VHRGRGMHYDPISRRGTTRYGGYRHGLLVKIGLPSPMRSRFGVAVLRFARDDKHTPGTVDGVLRPVCSRMLAAEMAPAPKRVGG
jgi:hypothetical protein